MNTFVQSFKTMGKSGGKINMKYDNVKRNKNTTYQLSDSAPSSCPDRNLMMWHTRRAQENLHLGGSRDASSRCIWRGRRRDRRKSSLQWCGSLQSKRGKGGLLVFCRQRPKLNKEDSHKQDHSNKRHEESLSGDVAATTFVYLWETKKNRERWDGRKSKTQYRTSHFLNPTCNFFYLILLKIEAKRFVAWDNLNWLWANIKIHKWKMSLAFLELNSLQTVTIWSYWKKNCMPVMIRVRPDSYQILWKNQNEARGHASEAAEQSWSLALLLATICCHQLMYKCQWMS